MCLVTVDVKARIVTVKGPRGEVKKNFSHLAVELQKMNLKEKRRNGIHIRIRMWFGGYKQACSVNTLKSLIENMIIGVTEVSQVPIRVRTGPLSVSELVGCIVSCRLFSFDLINYIL